MWKIFKKVGKFILGLILLLIASIILFVNLSPEFGGKISKAHKAVFETSKNYHEGKFVNQKDVKLDMSFSDMRKTLIAYFNPISNTLPKSNIEVKKIDSLSIVNYNNETRLIWFGHSTFLLQMQGSTILLDPMFGKVPAPHPMLGNERFSDELPIDIEKLPNIDAVIISHDHYDHLDYGSIKKLKGKVGKFYVPLGVGIHLAAWGIEKEKIIELDWWQEAKFEDLRFTCTPAQHFSGRGLTDRSSTLWSSWVIRSNTETIFFNGDSGYGPHFKEIGDKFGPFDFAMMECGQYNELWSEIHMFPEETAQAALDLKAKIMMPIHWGAFKLALHRWKDPVERVSVKAKELKVNLITPKIGEEINLLGNSNYDSTWWRRIE